MFGRDLKLRPQEDYRWLREWTVSAATQGLYCSPGRENQVLHIRFSGLHHSDPRTTTIHHPPPTTHHPLHTTHGLSWAWERRYDPKWT